MKTIFGNRKTLVSISAIMLALVLMTGGTLAWLTVGMDPAKPIQFGWLDVKSDVFDIYGPEYNDKVIFVQPGEKYPKKGTIKNIGTLDAWLEISSPEIWFVQLDGNSPVKDANGDFIRTVLAPKDQYEATYTINEPAGPQTLTNFVIWSDATANDYYGMLASRTYPSALPAPSVFMKLIGGRSYGGVYVDKDRYFLVMPGAGDYYIQDVGYNPVYVGGVAQTQNFPEFSINVESLLDLTLAGKLGGNQWNAAQMDAAAMQGTQTLQDAVGDVLGVTPAMIAGLVYADTRMVTLSRGAAAPTPFDVLQDFYGF